MLKPWLLALRSLGRRPGFVSAVVTILAVGIGAVTAVFSAVDAVLLKPLPYPDPGRLVTVYEASPAKSEKQSLLAPARLEDWNRMNRTFEAIAGVYFENVTDTSASEPERLAARRVSPRYFDVFGTRPLLGRTFTPAEEVDGGPASAVISYGLWARRYQQAPDAIGRRLILGGTGFTIVGVMPKEFSSPAIDLWLTAQLNASLVRIREARFYNGIGRMKPGVTIAQAQQDLARVQRQLGEEFPQTDRGWSAELHDLKEFRVGDYRRALLLVFGAVGLLLLIGVANVAGLMLAAFHRRERELAIRSAIGGTRAQVVAGVMREVLWLSAAGVALGCAVASWLADFLARALREMPHSAEFQLDWRALLFAASTGVLAALLSGLLPALQATRADAAAALSRGGRSSGRHTWQPALVAGQIALTVLLLASAGLMLRSYYNLSHVELGFTPARAVTFHVGAAWGEDRKRVGEMQEEILAKLQQLPGVEAAGFANFLPAMGATLRYQLALDGMARGGEAGKITVGERSISRGYLKALGAPLAAGQDCPHLRALSNGSPKALVSRRFAEMYGNGESLVGRHFRWLQDPPDAPPTEIVGVVADMREDTLNVTAPPYVYACIAPGGWPDPEYVARAEGDPRSLTQSIRSVVHGIDSARAVFGVQTLRGFLDGLLEQPRLNTRILTLFALAAMSLASVGLYSLVTLAVTARTREIGVRMALGADAGRIVCYVLARAARLLVVGIAAGLLLTLAAERVLRSVLFGVSPLDAATLAAAILVLAAVSAVATLVPARRAAKIDPLEAIRAE